MDQNLKTASEALARAAAASTGKDEPTKTYIAMERIDAGTRQYDIGEEIELTEAAAKQPLKLGSILPAGDKLTTKVAAASKEKDTQEIADARTKLEQRAAGTEPNNLGRGADGKPVSLNPGYQLGEVDDKGKFSANLPAGKSATVVKGAPRAAGQVVPAARAQVAPAARANVGRAPTKVSTGAPASTAGKAPVGGKSVRK